MGLILYQNSNFWCFWTPTLLKIYVRSTLCLHLAEIGCALGNANSNYWQIFGVRLQGVSSDLSLTGPAVCAGIFRLSISMGKQFSTDYLKRLVQSLCNFFIKRIAHFGHFWPILAQICIVFLERIFCMMENLETCKDWSAPPGASLKQKLTLAHTNNLQFINPDKKDLSGKPR